MRRFQRITTGALLIAMAATCLVGCVRRMATITSDPPGAKCWVNGVYRGETPVEIPYNWNWFYDIRLQKPGYQELTSRERFYAAPQHVMPLDLVAEMAPVKSKESQWRHYVLIPNREL